MADEMTHALLVANGTYPGEPDEVWQVGIRLIINHDATPPVDHGTLPVNTVSDDSVSRTESLWDITSRWKLLSGLDVFQPDDYLNDQAAPAFTTWIGAYPISTDCKLDRLKLSPITAAGKVSLLRTAELTWTSSNPGGSDSTPQMPLQIAMASSWQTPVLGRRGRGRIYPPASGTGKVSGGSGVFNSSDCNAARDASIALLEALSFLHTGFGWSTVPIVTGAPWTKYGEILEVRVSNIPDTQRRRRNRLPPTYHTGAVSY